MSDRVVKEDGAEPDRLGLLFGALARSSTLTFVVLALSAALALGTQLLLARLLGADEFGRYLYALNWVNALAALAVLGFDAAALRFVAAYRATAEWGRLRGFMQAAARGIAFGSLLGVVALGGVFALVVARANRAFAAIGLAALPLLPILAVSKFLAAVLQAQARAVLSQTLIGVLRPVIFVVAVGATVAFAPGFDGVATMIANVTAAVLVMLATLWWTRRTLPAPFWEVRPALQATEWRRSILAQWGIVVAQVGLLYTDTLMVGLLLTTLDAGVYAVSAQLASLVGFAVPALTAVTAPIMAGLHADSRTHDLRRVIGVVARSATVYAGLAFVVLGAVGGVILGLFGGGFVRAREALAVLALAQVVIAIHAPAGFALTMTGREPEGMVDRARL